MISLFKRIRQFDVYTKPLEDFRIKTLSGGAVTIVSAILIVALIISEFRLFLTTEIVEELFVDSSFGNNRVNITFDVFFPKMSCPLISIDVMDISGDHQSDLKDAVFKQRIDQFGREIADFPVKQEINLNQTTLPTTVEKPNCGSCYGAELYPNHCCNTCDDVKEAYVAKNWAMIDMELVEQCKSDSWLQTRNNHKSEGCKVYGKVQVAKVGGNFHIAPGHTIPDQHSHVHDLHTMLPEKFDTSHTINHLSFGTSYPGKSYPLDGSNYTAYEGGVMFQYFIKVVPTMFVHLRQNKIFTHQYSVTRHHKTIKTRTSNGLPGFFVQYDFSPLMIKFEEKRQSLTHFLVSLCAIIGGVFTVASLVDSFIYRSSEVIAQKITLGKTS